jgi:Vitamin K-dependent gamma-carboxylase
VRDRSAAAVIRRALDRWFSTAPPERLAMMRILAGAFAMVYIVALVPMWLADSHFHGPDFRPLGIVRAVGAHPHSRAVRLVLVASTTLLAGLFTIGWRYRFIAPLFAGMLLWLLTYRNSWGIPFHTENVLVLHVMVLAIVPAADAWSIDARGHSAPAAAECYGWPLRLLAAITAATYVIAGVSKLRLGGWAWLDGEVLREHIAVDNLRKHLLGAPMSPLATTFIEQPVLMRGLAVATLVIELGAPLAMLHRRIAAVWSIAAWGFHVGVMLLMAIVFLYPLTFVAYAPLFRCERPVQWGLARWRLKRSADAERG